MLTVALVCALCGSMTFQSCIGSFSLTNKLLSWNNTIGNKFVNELVFFAFWVIPVYEVSCLADVLVLNSIEFWSGDNPVAKGKTVIDGQDGKYLVECDGKGYTIRSLNDGTETRLNFIEDERTWTVVTASGEEMPLVTFVDDTHVSMPAGDGSFQTVELSQEGLYAYQSAVLGNSNLAQR